MNHERDSIMWLGSVHASGVRVMTELVEVIKWHHDPTGRRTVGS
jgi:hypothetical protein